MLGRLRCLILLEFATFSSGVGNGITSVALPWLVLERTGSAAAAGLVAAATAVPLVLVALFSGTVVDLAGRLRTAIIADVLSATSVLLIPLVDALGLLSVGLLAALAVLGALFDPAGASARESMLPEAAGRARWSLDRANGIHETVFGLAYLVGPGLGGLLIAFLGASGALFGTGAGFIVAALSAVALRGLPGSGRPAERVRAKALWHGTVDGLRFVIHDRLLLPLTLLFTLVIAFYYPIEGVVLPVHFTAAGAPQRLGVVLMAMSGGIIAGSLSYELLVRWRSRRTVFIVAMAGATSSLVWMSFLSGFVQILVAAALSGMFWGPVGPLLNYAIQSRTPNEMRGRVVGTINSASLAAGPVGLVGVGFLVEAAGARPAFLGLAIALFAVMLLAVALRVWKLLDAEPVPGSAASDDVARKTRGSSDASGDQNPPSGQ
jgi:MFS family permease